uniref:Exopolygalacturonase n=1 Tax=Elaeis guineensis var. tenera TaxID=51953 RepID=A0A8N4EVT2_ELAGV|nr:uncharacterized protein LOC105035869 [Elaeis guineensis]
MAKLIIFFLLKLFLLCSLPRSNAVYNVLNFGAKADGKTDSAQPLLKAWAAACRSSSPATIHVPAGSFLLSQAIFNGPCKNTAIKFSIDGTIISPSYYGKSGASKEWIAFNNVEGVTIRGGNLDGRGGALWTCKFDGRSCPTGATSLTFSNSKNIMIDGVTSINSELFHIAIVGCQGVRIQGVYILASGNSPNTDGIHVQMSTGVSIVRANIKTGDDCISIGPGTSHLWIERVFCGPGHGISIGSLGKSGDGLQVKGVQNVTAKSVMFANTQNGFRIKTWGTNARGYVKGVAFVNALMRNVQNPIIIDQNYCPGNQNCPGQNSGIEISHVNYKNIRGTSATEVAVNFDCSPSNPCNKIRLKDIKLTYQNRRAWSSCKHAYGIATGSVIPTSCYGNIGQNLKKMLILLFYLFVILRCFHLRLDGSPVESWKPSSAAPGPTVSPPPKSLSVSLSLRGMEMAEGEEVRNKQVVLKGFIVGAPKETDMELREGTAMLRAPKGSGAILVKNLYLSCDPYMRGRMRENYDSYIPPFQPGSVIEGFGVSKVVDSDNPSFGVGDLVSGLTGWEEYSLISKTERLRKIQINDIPLSYHLGLLGMPGFTAYAGFYEICSPKNGEYVFVSAASGAVGQLVGQLAKLHGCYVVGSAGTRQKVDLLKDKLGFDEAFNYKEESDLNMALKRYFPEGIDIYFDNVGGPMLDAVLLNMRLHGRIAVCGMVSQSGVSVPQGICNLLCLVTKRVRMQGFLQHDHLHLFPQFLDHMVSYYKQGKVVYIEDMSEGLESAPNSFVGLFTGKNVGKQVVCVSEE